MTDLFSTICEISNLKRFYQDQIALVVDHATYVKLLAYVRNESSSVSGILFPKLKDGVLFVGKFPVVSFKSIALFSHILDLIEECECDDSYKAQKGVPNFPHVSLATLKRLVQEPPQQPRVWEIIDDLRLKLDAVVAAYPDDTSAENVLKEIKMQLEAL